MADLEVSYEDGIATLTMNRPESRNALSMEMRSALADVLHDSIEGTFNAQAEDGSVEEIARTILRLRAECSAGNVATATTYIQQAASDLSSSVGREDEAGEVEEVVAPAPAPLPIIDEDGFETVQTRRRNPRRACAP